MYLGGNGKFRSSKMLLSSSLCFLNQSYTFLSSPSIFITCTIICLSARSTLVLPMSATLSKTIPLTGVKTALLTPLNFPFSKQNAPNSTNCPSDIGYWSSRMRHDPAHRSWGIRAQGGVRDCWHSRFVPADAGDRGSGLPRSLHSRCRRNTVSSREKCTLNCPQEERDRQVNLPDFSHF